MDSKILRTSFITLIGLLAFSASSYASTLYSQDWEDRVDDWNTQPSVIADDGWTIGLFDQTTGASWFANFGAPNNAADGFSGFSTLLDNQGGPAQGSVQMAVYPDYNPWGIWGQQSPMHTVTSVVSNELGTISQDLVGRKIRFEFDYKTDYQFDANAAEAFIYVLKQSDSTYYDLLGNFAVFDTANSGEFWQRGIIEFNVIPQMAGELLMIGFNTTAENYENGIVYYDNLSVTAVPLPAAFWLFGGALLALVGLRKTENYV